MTFLWPLETKRLHYEKMILRLLLFSIFAKAEETYIECVSVKTHGGGYLLMKIEFSHQKLLYNSNVTNIDKVTKAKTTLRFCLTAKTKLERIYVTSNERDSKWSGEIFVKRKYSLVEN